MLHYPPTNFKAVLIAFLFTLIFLIVSFRSYSGSSLALD